MPFDPHYDRPDNVPPDASWCTGCGLYHVSFGQFGDFDSNSRTVDDPEFRAIDEYDYDNNDDDDNDDDGNCTIHHYNYKPDPIFLGEGPLFLGAEIEVECGYRQRPSAVRCVEEHLGWREDVAYMKDDGSLNNGIEIVTHPMTYAWAMDRFPWGMFESLAQAGAYADSNCGLHVHVSRQGFRSRFHEMAWMRFIYSHEGQVCKLARRRGSTYASFHRDKDDLVRAVKGDTDFDRYRAINVQNYATYEVRAFASSVDAETIQATLGFVDASVRYAGTLRSHDVITDKRGSWRDFTAYVNDRDEYAPLSCQLDKLSLVPA